MIQRTSSALKRAGLLAGLITVLLVMATCLIQGADDAQLKADLVKARAMAAADQSETADFHRLIQKLAPHFQTVPVAVGDSTNHFFKIDVNRLGTGFDGIRFKVPPGEDRKLVWIFASNKKNPVVRWMIAGKEGPVITFHRVSHSEGNNPNRDYFGSAYDYYVPWGWEAKAKRTTIHVVDVNSEKKVPLKAGQEYVIWLHFRENTPTELQAAITLTSGQTELMNTWEQDRALDLYEE